MSNGFERHLEAQRHAEAITSLPARAALRYLHRLILETVGLQLYFLPERYQSIHTVDSLFLYQAVERLFAEWTDEIRCLPEAPGNRERLLRLQEAEDLIPTLPTERARVGLANFISILLATPVPARTFVDALFCSRLVAVLLSYPGLLDRILSGEAEAVYVWDD
ncbi:MAG TPA: hypothetical protein VMF69_12065 [Gemmataceae bacterium]|nr:hypothetical protein [Gemmataceae bacterium]